jgi:hypothetical protein
MPGTNSNTANGKSVNVIFKVRYTKGRSLSSLRRDAKNLSNPEVDGLTLAGSIIAAKFFITSAI